MPGDPFYVNTLLPVTTCTVVMTINQKPSALDSQVGGSHYKDMPIQPIEFIHKNNLGKLQGDIIKYVVRYKDKNGKQDLVKAIHCLQLLIELDYGKEDSPDDSKRV